MEEFALESSLQLCLLVLALEDQLSVGTTHSVYMVVQFELNSVDTVLIILARLDLQCMEEEMFLQNVGTGSAGEDKIDLGLGVVYGGAAPCGR